MNAAQVNGSVVVDSVLATCAEEVMESDGSRLSENERRREEVVFCACDNFMSAVLLQQTS